MQNAVIYARYSSHSQTEQSIEGQLHDGYAYAEKCGYHVIGEYIDRALTGTKDDRPDFQRMIKDAEKKHFQVIIVWKLDRFARNRYDSAIYKRTLKKHGVRVVSVMENITDSPEGIILEGMLEALAEYYSANLSENIKRGQKESINKGWVPGGSAPFGYRIVDHKLELDERTAPIIVELYSRYADGDSLADIASDLNKRGYRTRQGREFKTGTFDKILPNPAYIGEYQYSGSVIKCPPLITKELYDKAVARRKSNKRAPASNRSPVEYLLTGKLFCGECGSPMSGIAGTSRHGYRCTYYCCTGHKYKRNDCKKKSEKHEFIEWYVCEQTVNYVLSPSNMNSIADRIVNIYNSDTNTDKIRTLETSIQRCKDEINSLVDKVISAPKSALKPIYDRIEIMEQQRQDLEADLSKLKMQQAIPLTVKEVKAWLSTFSKSDILETVSKREIINTFVNSVYLYNDKIVIFFNIRGGKQISAIDTISELDEKIPGQGSSLTGSSGEPLTKEEPLWVFVGGLLGIVMFRNEE